MGNQEGLWYLVTRMLEVTGVMEVTRTLATENTVVPYFTGSGLGGSFAALTTMYFRKTQSRNYKAYAFSPVGFQCTAKRLYEASSYMDHFADHSSWVKVYRHPMDVYSELGMGVLGYVCNYGLADFIARHDLRGYCGQIVGFTGAQLMCDSVPKFGNSEDNCRRHMSPRYGDPDERYR